jgi:hypothetical protein
MVLHMALPHQGTDALVRHQSDDEASARETAVDANVTALVNVSCC